MAKGKVVPFRRQQLDLPGDQTQVSLALPEEMPFDDWAAVGETLCTVSGSAPWWLGDWWAYGVHHYGKRKEITDRLRDEGRKIPDFGTLRNYGYVAKAFEASFRSDAVPWTVHQVLAPVKDRAERLELLAEAEAEGWTVHQAKEAVSQAKAARALGCEVPAGDGCTVDDLQTLISEGRTFGAIYADPPWLYDNQGTRAATGKHYRGLTVEQLCELPVAKLAAADAHLHLWTTNGFLEESFGLMETWGFTFKSSFVWVKPQMGLGNYWRNSHELLLTGMRGKARRFRDKSLRSWLEADRDQHSGKPEEVRGFIERASPGPRLELFGREQADGWTVWGNQVRRDLLVAAE
jgi:N6-adenosine-specific RNA methylase IME4